MGRCHLVAEAQHHLSAMRELAVHLREVLFVGVLVQIRISLHVAHGDLGDGHGYLPLVLVAEDEVAVLHEAVQGGVGIGTLILPEVLAEVDVAGDAETGGPGGFNGLEGGVRGALGDGAGDAGAVEDIGLGENVFPGIHARGGGVEGRSGPVVDDLGAAEVLCRLIIIGADALAAKDDVVHVHPAVTEGVLAGGREVVVREAGHVLYVIAQKGQGDGYVGLASAKLAFPYIALPKAPCALFGVAEHYLSEGYYPFSHTESLEKRIKDTNFVRFSVKNITNRKQFLILVDRK